MFGFFKKKLSQELLKEITFYDEAMRRLGAEDPLALSKIGEGARTIWPSVLSNINTNTPFNSIARIACYNGLEDTAKQLIQRGDNTRGTGIKIVTIWLRTSLLDDAAAKAAHLIAARLLARLGLDAPEIQSGATQETA